MSVNGSSPTEEPDANGEPLSAVTSPNKPGGSQTPQRFMAPVPPPPAGQQQQASQPISIPLLAEAAVANSSFASLNAASAEGTSIPQQPSSALPSPKAVTPTMAAKDNASSLWEASEQPGSLKRSDSSGGSTSMLGKRKQHPNQIDVSVDAGAPSIGSASGRAPSTTGSGVAGNGNHSPYMTLASARPPQAPAKNSRRCNCKNSRCLKLYCECFAQGKYCTSACRCRSCCNNEAKKEERMQAIESTLERNPLAFKPKIAFENIDVESASPGARHMKGCNCKKSGCLKKYCECFQAGVFCSGVCKCSSCKNYQGSQLLLQARTARQHGAQTPSSVPSTPQQGNGAGTSGNTQNAVPARSPNQITTSATASASRTQHAEDSDNKVCTERLFEPSPSALQQLRQTLSKAAEAGNPNSVVSAFGALLKQGWPAAGRNSSM